jgi:hypothetical protein
MDDGGRATGGGMNTHDIMQVALDLGGFEELPPDSGVWVEGNNLSRILVGLDVGAAELKIAHDLGFDAVVAHHPVRRQGFWQVFERHRELMRSAGVPDEAVRAALDERSAAMRLSAETANDDHVVSVARLLRMPFLNVHLPLDEYGRRAITETVASCLRDNANASVQEVAGAIGQLATFRRLQADPVVVYGAGNAPAGRVVVSLAAGTNGGFPVAAAYLAHGIDTVIYMHIDAADLGRLRRSELCGNLIITGHVPGDGIGMDAFVCELRRRGLEVTTFSGVDTPVEE